MRDQSLCCCIQAPSFDAGTAWNHDVLQQRHNLASIPSASGGSRSHMAPLAAWSSCGPELARTVLRCCTGVLQTACCIVSYHPTLRDLTAAIPDRSSISIVNAVLSGPSIHLSGAIAKSSREKPQRWRSETAGPLAHCPTFRFLGTRGGSRLVSGTNKYLVNNFRPFASRLRPSLRVTLDRGIDATASGQGSQGQTDPGRMCAMNVLFPQHDLPNLGLMMKGVRQGCAPPFASPSLR